LIVVIGCYSQLNEINENKIGIILGTKYKNKLSSLIKEYNGDKIIKIDTLSEKDCFEEFNNPLNFTSTRAFIKIQDGCNFMCSYCLIPQARGKQRSLHHNKVISLIYLLISKQYKEIILSGINVSGYYDGE
jgi:threonylcarbamoyladenosine tRNA methylthiotransferase MtaB